MWEQVIQLKYTLAIDIGASSGRHIVGWMEEGRIQTKEVYRFPNGVKEEAGHLVWDIEALLREVKTGIRAAKAEFPEIKSLSIDTWGVDYVLLKEDKESKRDEQHRRHQRRYEPPPGRRTPHT